MRVGRLGAAAAAGALLASLPSGVAVAQGGQDELAEVRQATAQYHDVDRAIADGYTPTEECVPGMGYHYVNFDLFGAPLDPLKPAGLIYARNDGGKLKLVAVEYFVVDEDQNPATHNATVPSMFGHTFEGPMPGHGGEMPVHYDLHAYLWKANPDGVLSPWNDKISCPE